MLGTQGILTYKNLNNSSGLLAHMVLDFDNRLAVQVLGKIVSYCWF